MEFKKSFAVNTEKAEEGVWFEFEDAEFLVARTRSTKYRNEITRLSKKYRKQIDLGVLPRAKSEEIVLQAMANTILNGWRGQVKFEPDSPHVPYTRENALKALTDYPDFRDLVTSWAEDIEAYQADEDNENRKNSVNLSGGS